MRNRFVLAISVLFSVGAFQVSAAAPDWLQTVAREALSAYPASTPAAMLLDEQVTTVKSNGEVTTVYHGAYKILRPEGKRYGVVQVYYDAETRISSLRGWSIPPRGAAYEAGEKETTDAILFTDNLYEDARQKVLRIPAAEPGAVIGYEYEQRRRPSILQDRWLFQREIPVRRARFSVNLPAAWEHREVWTNHAPVPSTGPTQATWELSDIPAVEEEPAMPAWEGIAGQLLLTYIRPNGGNFRSWSDVGQWYAQLAAGRRQSSPELRQKALELTSSASTALGKIRALSSFVQREVRYVAIEIGKGGYQPHPASDIFKSRYGDCKDKATLLSAMLREIGVESYYVLIDSQRGVVNPEFASPLLFDHAILAVRMPAEGAGNLPGGISHAQLGTLVFFDPTEPYVVFGELPAILQASHGLLVTDMGGELVKLPLAPASSNVVERTASLQLSPDGSAEGEVREVRRGSTAADFRAAWLNASESERRKSIQSRLARDAANIELKDVSAKDVDQPDRDPVLTYHFRIARYAALAGGLMLLQPALSEWGVELTQTGDRKQPVEFSSTLQRSEAVEITLPDGFVVDELPPPVAMDTGTVAYRSSVEVNERILRYTRRLEISDVVTPAAQLLRLKDLYHQIGVSEKAKSVLKPR